MKMNMNSREDRMWADVVDADTPSAAEMAEAEKEMQALGEVAPLSAADVDAMVALATKGPGVVVAGGVVGEVGRARRFRQPMFKVAAAVLLLIAIAQLPWAPHWAGEQVSQDLDYKQAIELATEPNREDKAYLGALGLIVDRCGFAADTLRELASQVKEPVLAAQAHEIAGRLSDLLINGPREKPEVVDHRIADCASTALGDAELQFRQEALTHLGGLARSGLTAMWFSPLKGAEAQAIRKGWIERILGKLPR